MLTTKLKLDRDEFVEALACWVRWRGHAIPHNMLSERFPAVAGAIGFPELKKVSQHIGIHISYKKRASALPKPEQFPLTIGVAIVYALELILRTFRAYIIDYAGKKVDLDISEKVFNQGVGIRMEARPQQTGTFISQLRK